MPQTIARDPYLAAMTEAQVAFRISDCNESLAKLTSLIQTDDVMHCQAYWFIQRKKALTELYGRQKRRAM